MTLSESSRHIPLRDENQGGEIKGSCDMHGTGVDADKHLSETHHRKELTRAAKIPGGKEKPFTTRNLFMALNANLPDPKFSTPLIDKALPIAPSGHGGAGFPPRVNQTEGKIIFTGASE